MRRIAIALFGALFFSGAAFGQNAKLFDIKEGFLRPPTESEPGFGILSNIIWEQYIVLAAMSGVDRNNLEGLIGIGSNAGFGERRVRDEFLDEVEEAATRQMPLLDATLSSDMYVFSSIPAPEYDFRRKGFSFCIPTTVFSNPSNLSLDDRYFDMRGQFQIDFSDLRGLGGIVNGPSCRDPKSSVTGKYTGLPFSEGVPGIPGDIDVSNVGLGTYMFMSVKEQDIAERMDAYIKSVENETLQAYVACESIKFSAQGAVAKCIPNTISIGRYDGMMEDLVQLVKQPDGSWGRAIDARFK